MLETKEVTINSKKFLCTQFMAREGLKLQFRLIKQLGPVMGTLASEGDIDASSIAKALSQKIDEDACFDLVMDLLKSTKYKNQDIRGTDFDIAFAGDYKTLFELLYFIIDLNYGNFFGAGGIGGLFSTREEATTEGSSIKTA